MTTTTWIICERSSRWTAALRVAFSRQSTQPACSTALHEVRSLVELSDRFQMHRNSLLLIEVRPTNLEAVLTWLADTTNQAKHATAVALLDCHNTAGQEWSSYNRDLAANSLREAGALDVIHSPRRIRDLLALGARHAAKCNVATSPHPSADQSFDDWAWSLLPWQEAGRPLGCVET